MKEEVLNLRWDGGNGNEFHRREGGVEVMQIQYLYMKFSKIKIDLNINYLTPEIDITKLRLLRTLVMADNI